LKEPAVRNHIFDIAKFWLEEVGIDGWRLDVAHEIEPDFWREFRSVCDSVDKDALLVGEMIHGNYNDWVGHDRLHSGTNYQMSHATWHSLNEHNYEVRFLSREITLALYCVVRVHPDGF
jgi:glycosidase